MMISEFEYCPYCGAKLIVKGRFCHKCGMQLIAEVKCDTPKSEKSAEKLVPSEPKLSPPNHTYHGPRHRENGIRTYGIRI